MSKRSFAVSPVHGYRLPRYASLTRESLFRQAAWLLVRVGRKAAKTASLLLLMAGLSLTAPACSSSNSDPWEQTTCAENLKGCVDDQTVGDCVQGDAPKRLTCNEYCEENYGYSASGLCNDKNPSNLCDCRYETTDGVGFDPCTEDSMECSGSSSVSVCEEGEYPDLITCEQYCQEKFGNGYYSGGSCNDENPSNLCDCRYAIADGDVGFEPCTLDSMECSGSFSVSVCEEGEYPDLMSCEQYCQEKFGNGYYSAGDCNDENPSNLCGCYDIYSETDGIEGEGGGDYDVDLPDIDTDPTDEEQTEIDPSEGESSDDDRVEQELSDGDAPDSDLSEPEPEETENGERESFETAEEETEAVRTRR